MLILDAGRGGGGGAREHKSQQDATPNSAPLCNGIEKVLDVCVFFYLVITIPYPPTTPWNAFQRLYRSRSNQLLFLLLLIAR